MSELKGKITFLAYRPLTQQSAVLRPCEDASGRLYTGQGQYGYFEMLSEEEKRTLPIIVNHDTSFQVSHERVLDLDNPIDREMWKWIRKHPFISEERETGITKYKDKLFYVANPTKDAETRVDATEKIDEARYKIRQLSYEDKCLAAEAALTLIQPKALNEKEITDRLLNFCATKEGATIILDSIAPENRSRVNAGIAFDKMVAYAVITRERDGGFYFGGPDGVVLGHIKEAVVTYMLDKENIERVKLMKQMLAEARHE